MGFGSVDIEKRLSERLERLREELSRASGSSGMLESLIRDAISNTLLCSALYKDFLITMTVRVRSTKEGLSEIMHSSDDLKEASRQLRELSASTDDPQLRATLEECAQAGEDSASGMPELCGEAAQFHKRFYGFGASLMTRTLNDVLTMHKSRDLSATIDAFLEYIIGELPPGRFVAAFEALRKVWEGELAKVRDAAGYVGGLESYGAAAFYWSVTCQMLVHALCGRQPDVAIAVSELEARRAQLAL